MKTPAALLASVLALSLSSSACAQHASNGWLVGFWAQIEDEDGKPLDDTIEFRADGTVVSYFSNCEVLAESTYHLHDDKVYVTAQVKKGFISLLFVPSQDHKRIVMTSVRTANNAVYERAAPGVGCVPVKS